jgi:hypothetical protein
MLMALFLSLFALDAFGKEQSFRESLAAVAIHLVPAAVLLVIVALSWRREWIGGVASIGLAAIYAMMVRGRLDWVLVISAPLLVIGTAFLWSWARHSELHAPDATSHHGSAPAP